MAATGVADRAPERLAQLVYFDAFVPRDAQCLFDLLASETRARRVAIAHLPTSEPAGEAARGSYEDNPTTGV